MPSKNLLSLDATRAADESSAMGLQFKSVPIKIPSPPHILTFRLFLYAIYKKVNFEGYPRDFLAKR